MSLNVEMIGGSIVVQHYVEDIAEKSHVRMISHSDVFSPNGRTKVQIIWELSVKAIDAKSCEFTISTVCRIRRPSRPVNSPRRHTTASKRRSSPRASKGMRSKALEL